MKLKKEERRAKLKMLLIARKKLRHKVFCHINSLAPFVLCEITDLLLLFSWHHLLSVCERMSSSVYFYVKIWKFFELQLTFSKVSKLKRVLYVMKGWKLMFSRVIYRQFKRKTHAQIHYLATPEIIL